MPRKQNFRDRTTAEVLVGGKTTTMRGELMRHPAVVADLASRCTESCGDSPAGWCTIWYMITDSSVDIDAPASLVWDVFSDVERWPEWTASVTCLVAVDGPGIAVGKRFEIKQPRMPKLVWEVTEVVPGSSWTWVQRFPAGSTVARHDVAAKTNGHTLVRQQLDQRGVSALVGRIMYGMTTRYLELEAQGLKARSEQRSRLDGPAS